MSDDTPIRRCTKCLNEYPATTEHFGRCKGGKYGLKSWCKDCCKNEYNSWYSNGGNAVVHDWSQSARGKESHAKTLERRKDKNSAYEQLESTKELRRAARRRWEINHPDLVAAYKQSPRGIEVARQSRIAYEQRTQEDRVCPICQKAFSAPAKSRLIYCSRNCSKLGPNNPQWENGKSLEGYPPEWNKKLRKSIRQRDGYICALCGASDSRDVHHISYEKQDCSPENLITLCHDCHSATNTNRTYWIDIFRLIVQEKSS